MLGQWGEISKVRVNRKAETGLRTPLKIVCFLRDMVIVFWDRRVNVEGLPTFVSPDICALLITSEHG